ncbi:Oidioi.mRNA.OKI2018_I69.chrUn_2.g17224.t1.cds [Oikopleura dioica]|uniref:Oidioi.mRNA.OKI2018_I69.chrUn_2.g17224.t1.c ds n=1 Tax=Oikopleura dioica TaxID=34765 RepID=A0ABN7T9R7_OIKDI|nr:Oidioi.mRNA.OKI2018_I69.chrUn_2.g17224.t1.cds [Oikopleura dioica]
MTHQFEISSSLKTTIQRLKDRLYLRKVAAKERAIEKLQQEVKRRNFAKRKDAHDSFKLALMHGHSPTDDLIPLPITRFNQYSSKI